VKRSRIVKEVFRDTKEEFSDLVMVVACGLHNLRVRSRKRRLRTWEKVIPHKVYLWRTALQHIQP